MNITLNGEPTGIADATTIGHLVASRSLPSRGIAVAVNSQVVRAGEWPAYVLADGDVIDIVTARQGG